MDTHDLLVLGGRIVPDARDRIRRYCGLPWSGGPPETWDFHFYDAVPTEPGNSIDPVDVVITAAVHPGLSRTDFAFFREGRDEIEAWLADVPTGVALAHADAEVLDYLDTLADADTFTHDHVPTLSLLTKVLHRKRPQLIPLVDRHILDWYRPTTGERSGPAAWRKLLRVLRDDLDNNSVVLGDLTTEVAADTGVPTTPLRMVDITIWMRGR